MWCGETNSWCDTRCGETSCETWNGEMSSICTRPCLYKLPLNFCEDSKCSMQWCCATQTTTVIRRLLIEDFSWGRQVLRMIVRNDKIVIPKTLQQRVVEWYHWHLCHPGETCTENTIHLHYWWDKLRDTVHNVCNKCHTCQMTKKTFQKYGHLPEKLSLIHIWRCRRSYACRSRWSPYH